jgi:predicted RNA-binding Zn-ribbon protein involved in translation (DUF1610 family)
MADYKASLGLEDKLNLAFANAVDESIEFRVWLLQRTKFRDAATNSSLLKNEQEKARSARFWWRHWWCSLPELGGDSETDIFLAFEEPSGKRFCLHIENKLAKSTFTRGQEDNYAIRAEYMLTHTKSAKLRCTDFETVLIAPREFLRTHSDKAEKFGSKISHEEIAEYVSVFGTGGHSVSVSTSSENINYSNDGSDSKGLLPSRPEQTIISAQDFTRRAFVCPTCKSKNIRKQSLIYGAGTSEYNSTSLSTGIANRGRGIRIITTQGRKSTLLAAACAPPVMKQSPAVGYIIAGFFIGCSVAIFVNFYLGLLVFGIMAIGGVQVTKQATKDISVNYARQMEEWKSSFVCMKCGVKFKAID